MDNKLFKFEEKFVLNILKSDLHRTRIDLKVCSLVFFCCCCFGCCHKSVIDIYCFKYTLI